jgi:hypothetical protein
MFSSRRRPVVYPQAEHARLAAAVAAAWGNDAFARPRLPFDAFVTGVALHDRGYGELDADPVLDVPAARWNGIQRRGFAPDGHDPVVDLVVALHVRRLVSAARLRAERGLLEEMTAALPALHAAAGVDENDAAAADAITDLCDRIAFDFCFEEPAGGSVEVRPGPGAAPVRVFYAVDGEGGVTLSPWPLGVPSVTGVVLAFEAVGYPDAPVPAMTPFRVEERTLVRSTCDR